MDSTERFASAWKVLVWAFYLLAMVVVAMGLFIGLALANATSVIPAATIGLQSPAIRPLWDAIVTGLQFAGALIFAMGIVFGALLACGGLLLTRYLALAQRVRTLEVMLASAANSQPAEGNAKLAVHA